MTDFALMDIASIQAGLRAKEFTAREVAENALERVSTVDQQIHAFLETCPDLAFAAADRVDAAIAEGDLSRAGLLAGVPVAIGFVVYVLAAIALKVVTREDCLLLPKGEKIAKLLKL